MKHINKTNSQFKQLEASLIAHAHTEGKQQALFNKPTSLAEFKASFFNTLESKIQQEIVASNHATKPISGRVIAHQTQQNTNTKVHSLRGEYFDKEHDFQALKGQLADCNFNWMDVFKYYGVQFLVFLISLVEGFFIYQALIYSSFSQFSSMITGISLACGIAIVTEYFAVFIKKATSTKQLWFRILIVTIPMFIGFYAIAYLRIIGLANQQSIDSGFTQGSVSSTPMPSYILALLSFFIFIIGLIISIKYHRTIEEEEAYKQYRKTKREFRKVKKEMKVLNQAISKLEQNAHGVSSIAVQNHEEAVHAEKNLASIAKHALREFIQTNVKYRTDGLTPEFFSNPPQFQFDSFLNTLKQPHIQ